MKAAILQKNPWLPALLIAIVAMANALVYAEFAAGCASAIAAAENLSACQRLAEEIADREPAGRRFRQGCDVCSMGGIGPVRPTCNRN